MRDDSQASFGRHRREEVQEEIADEKEELFRKEAHPLLRAAGNRRLHAELQVLARAVYFEELTRVSLHRHIRGTMGEAVHTDQHVRVVINPATLATCNELADFYINQVEENMEK